MVYLGAALFWARHNLWCLVWIPPKTFGQFAVGPGFGGTIKWSVLCRIARVAPSWARVGLGGAVGCRDGACVVVGVEGSGGAVGSRDGAWVLLMLRLLSVVSGFISVTPGLFGTRSSYAREGALS